MSEEKPRPNPARLALLALVVAVIVASFFLPVQRWMLSLAEWVRGAGAAGVAVYVGVYVAGTLLFLPGSVLTLAAGFAWGPLWGTLIVWPTATLAASLCFLVARFVARDWVGRKVATHPKFASVDRAIGRQGFKIVTLLRLSPIFPFNFLNYALGLTTISFGRYVLASLIGMLPGTAMYVYLGSLVESASKLAEGAPRGGAAQQALYWGGLVATVAVAVVVTRVARRALAAELPPEAEA